MDYEFDLKLYEQDIPWIQCPRGKADVYYCKNWKQLETRKIAVIILQFEQGGFAIYIYVSKSCRQNWNTVDPDQTCVYTAQTCLSKYLGSL